MSIEEKKCAEEGSDAGIRQIRDESPMNAKARAYMARAMDMHEVYEDQEQNWILGHLVTFGLSLTVKARVEKVIAQHGRALELMSRGSAAVELENKLREQVAVEQLRAEQAEAQLAALTAELAHERHEKETVAEAGQAMVRYLTAERDRFREALTAILDDAVGANHDPLWIVRREFIEAAKVAVSLVPASSDGHKDTKKTI